MEQIADYYVTLKPIREGGKNPIGLKNIAFVDDPAVEELGIYLNLHDKKIVASESQQAEILEYLRSCGIEKPENWREVSEGEYLEARKTNLSTDPTSSESYNDFPQKGGGGQWLVRYMYTGPVDEKNRSFCSEVMSLGRLYTEEEISNGLSNPEFGNYSIFDYKGSYGCRHIWKRMIFFEDYEDKEVRRVGNVPQVVAKLDDDKATTLNAYLSKDEKMQVVAPLLIPEKKVFRNDEIGRYNMIFSKETILDIKAVAEKNKVFDNPELLKDTHRGTTAPSYVLEQWVTMSTEDKAYKDYGFDVSRCPIGTWFVHSQITDKKYWEKEIKLNKKHAYSIEAAINLSIIKLSTQKQEFGDVLVFNEKGEFLILQRSANDDYEPNKLCLPGGKIEQGEDIQVGAIRELFEETGITAETANFIETITNSDGTKSHYFSVETDQNFRPSHEHKGYSWVKSLDNFPNEMFIEGDKQRLVEIINKSKMEKGQIVLPDGEHLINGTIYVIKDGAVVEKKEVTPEQEKTVEEVAKKTPEEMAAEAKPTPPAEEKPEEKPAEEMAVETPPAPAPATPPAAPEAPAEDDRVAKLEARLEEVLEEVGKVRGMVETPKGEETTVEMSDNRPLWKKISDGLNVIKKQK